MLVLSILAAMLVAPPAVSSAAAGGLVVKGTVVRQANATVGTIGKSAATIVRGATVRLVWGNNAGREEAMTTWAMVTLAETTTDATGGYELRAAATPALEAAAVKNDGWVNFSLHIITPDGHIQMQAISRALVGGQWTGRGRQTFEPAHAVKSVLAFDKTGKILNGGKLTKTQLAAAAEPTITCYYITDRTWVQSTRIGDFHNTTGMDSYWQYGYTADSDIDVGIKYSGQNWGVSGSQHVGNSGGATETHRTSGMYDRYIRTNFSYIQYHDSCYWTTYLVATDWKGGAQDDGNTFQNCNVAPYANYKVIYGAGTDLHVTRTRATRIGYAIDAGPVNLGQTSGYSDRLDFDWAIRQRMLFCGAKDYPVGSTPGPGVIYNQNP
jgi:hypothetical protein